jgi:hypothetical protein
LPNGNKLKVTIEYKAICGMPNIAGAIDGSLIDIQRPSHPSGWYCSRWWPALNIFQAVVFSKGHFINLCIMYISDTPM